jgi:hypothetical protein
MRWLALVGLAIVSGCNHDALGPGDDDGGTLPDASLPAGSDGAANVPDGGLCTTHVFETVPVDMFQPVYFVYHQHQTVQVMLMVPLRAGCDLQGPVDVTLSPGNATDFVKVVAHRWRQVGGNCPAPERTPWVLALDDAGIGNLMLQVSDGAPNATALPITLKIDPSANSSCNPQPNDTCDADCQCINKFGAAFACLNGNCDISCNRDSDCATDGNSPACNTAEGIPFGCGPAPQCPASCPFGQSCDPKSGVCRPIPHQPFCTNCNCDIDCGPLGICGDGHCVSPCATSSDCFGGVMCNGVGDCAGLCAS